MPRIRSEKPRGRLTKEKNKAPNDLTASGGGLGRGVPARRRPGGLAQEGQSEGAIAMIRSHYSQNARLYNLVGAGLGGLILGMILSN